ncbi:MAG: thiamine pyrophosphate-dependent dehydrogenase E1 component subunit alpha [Aggregatilineales bacterium]
MAEIKTVPRHAQVGLSEERLRWALHGMMLARTVDDRLWLLSRQGRTHFVITGAGQEASQLGCALALRIGHDYVVPYYRDLALTLAMGQSPVDIFMHAMGKAGDPSSGGRQMFGHFSSRKLRLVSGSSSVGSHLVHASGIALGLRAQGIDDIAVMTCFGEGAAAEGAWHEGISFAGIHQLPVVFVCQNNQYAISVPLERELPVPDVAAKASGYGMPGVIVDGNDLLAVYEAAHEALTRARAGGGPTLLECKTYRLRPHSNADDDTKYRSREEVEMWRARDPITRLQQYLLEHDLITQDEITAFQARIAAEVDKAIEIAEQSPNPAVETLFDHLYGDDAE